MNKLLPQFVIKVSFSAIFLSLGIFLSLALFSFSTNDIGWTHVTSTNLVVTNLMGNSGAWFADVLYATLGYAAWLVPLIFFYEMLNVLFIKNTADAKFRYAGVFFCWLSVATLLTLLGFVFFNTNETKNPINLAGGIVGFEIAQGLVAFIGIGASVLFTLVMSILTFTFSYGVSWKKLLYAINDIFKARVLVPDDTAIKHATDSPTNPASSTTDLTMQVPDQSDTPSVIERLKPTNLKALLLKKKTANQLDTNNQDSDTQNFDAQNLEERNIDPRDIENGNDTNNDTANSTDNTNTSTETVSEDYLANLLENDLHKTERLDTKDDFDFTKPLDDFDGDNHNVLDDDSNSDSGINDLAESLTNHIEAPDIETPDIETHDIETLDSLNPLNTESLSESQANESMPEHMEFDFFELNEPNESANPKNDLHEILSLAPVDAKKTAPLESFIQDAQPIKSRIKCASEIKQPILHQYSEPENAQSQITESAQAQYPLNNPTQNNNQNFNQNKEHTRPLTEVKTNYSNQEQSLTQYDTNDSHRNSDIINTDIADSSSNIQQKPNNHQKDAQIQPEITQAMDIFNIDDTEDIDNNIDNTEYEVIDHSFGSILDSQIGDDLSMPNTQSTDNVLDSPTDFNSKSANQPLNEEADEHLTEESQLAMLESATKELEALSNQTLESHDKSAYAVNQASNKKPSQQNELLSQITAVESLIEQPIKPTANLPKKQRFDEPADVSFNQANDLNHIAQPIDAVPQNNNQNNQSNQSNLDNNQDNPSAKQSHQTDIKPTKKPIVQQKPDIPLANDVSTQKNISLNNSPEDNAFIAIQEDSFDIPAEALPFQHMNLTEGTSVQSAKTDIKHTIPTDKRTNSVAERTEPEFAEPEQASHKPAIEVETTLAENAFSEKTPTDIATIDKSMPAETKSVENMPAEQKLPDTEIKAEKPDAQTAIKEIDLNSVIETEEDNKEDPSEGDNSKNYDLEADVIETNLDNLPDSAIQPNQNSPANEPHKSRAFSVLEHRKTLSPLPSIELLEKPDPNRKPSYSPEELTRLAELLEIKLADYGIKATVITAQMGPVVTRFEVDLAAGVKVSKVNGISRDLARSLSMASVRVVEIIPGKPYIGIEVPNTKREMVRLHELLITDAYQNPKAGLSMAIGKDIGGNPVITDLAKAPHMLVAGTTGSGKSVAVNAMLLSLLLKYKPEELRLILIDPKQLELANYNDIPHLLTEVVTDMKDAASALNWCVSEMERRYRLMAYLKVRKLADYNLKLLESEKSGDNYLDPLWRPNDDVSTDKPPKLKPLPAVVVVADEFADMIMQVGKQAEELITRLAQKSRAAGIHLILATQRPSVDVITGLIKANIPTRVALRVNSKVDSRTILDTGGAEDMLGNGDMLFLGPGKIEAERAHGAYISDDEVNTICDAWRERGSPDYVEDMFDTFDIDNESSASSAPAKKGGEDDALYDDAVAFILETKKVSASSIQRNFSIGYNRAARIIDAMESAGIISSMGKNGKREIL